MSLRNNYTINLKKQEENLKQVKIKMMQDKPKLDKLKFCQPRDYQKPRITSNIK
jgi:hypothetical protein